MGNIRLTRRSFLEKGLKTSGGILLLGGSSLLSSCSTEEDLHYRFDLSRLEDWQAELFIKAGRDYWGVGSRDDSSRNKVYFGKPKKDKLAYASWEWELRNNPREIVQNGIGEICTFTVVFENDVNWANCSIEGSHGKDFYRAAAHEWGHMVNLKGKKIHSDNPEDIMYRKIIHRC